MVILPAGLVGENTGEITASYATGNVNGQASDRDWVGGLAGHNSNIGTIRDSYSTGAAHGGNGNTDRVGGFVGVNNGIIAASYATGDADDGPGMWERVAALVSESIGGSVTASYGFGAPTTAGGGQALKNSTDATTVGFPTSLHSGNSSTIVDNRWSTRVWDFMAGGGGTGRRPFLKLITDYNPSGATDALKYLCDPALLPSG